MSKIEEFVERNGMSESVKREMLEILNESLLEISRGIMESDKIIESKKGSKSEVENKKVGEKRYKSKKAEEYAEEHGIRIEEFEMKEISKKDVENKVREKTKVKNNPSSEKVVKKSDGGVEVKREKVICSGINKKGEACKSVGTIQPEGAKKKYCFRHAEDFRTFECDTDSSDEEVDEKVNKKVNEKVNEKVDEDELEEEEYN